LTADLETLHVYRVVVRRALAAGDPGLLPVHFETAVLDRYRGRPGYSLIRTDTVARLQKQGDWSIDFGIAPDEATIHTTANELRGLPEEDQQHWAAFAVIPPASKMFLQMRLAPSACYDDGEVRPWA
jgi:hypothetical protein